MMTNTIAQADARLDTELEIFQGYRRHLIDLVARIETVFGKLEIGSRARVLAQIRERLESDRFRVMILGEFKRGKSTVVNALLGEAVLPAKVVPCTAVISEIKWGESRRAMLHFRHPLPSPLPEKLPAEVVEHIRKAAGGPVPALEVPVERLTSYVSIPQPEKDQAESVAESPYERVELFWPLELCRNGVEIIDSPGLNEHESRTRITANYLQRVDAVLFTLLCLPLGSLLEFKVIDQDLRGAGHEYIFFLCNRFDDIPHGDREDVRQFALAKLKTRTRMEESGIFFLSARLGLEGRAERNAAKLEDSGILALEKALTRFLTRERGKVKLLQPARELMGALEEARYRTVPTQRQMLDASLAQLAAQYETAKPLLVEAERRKDQIAFSLENHRTSLHLQVRVEAEQHLRQLTAKIPAWVEEMETENKVKLLTFHAREQLKSLAKEMTDKVVEQIEKEVQAWRKKTLEPMIAAWQERLESDLAKKVEGFYSQLDQVNASFASLHASAEEDLGGISEKKRYWATGVGFLLLNPVAGVHGMRFGFRGLGVTLVSQVIITTLLIAMLGASNPVILLGLIIGGLLGGGFTGAKLEKELKGRLGRALQDKFRDQIHTTVEEIARQVDGEVKKVAASVEESLQGEIRSVREQVEAVLRDKRTGEVKVQGRKRLLDELEAELDESDSALKQLIFAVAGS